jgi:hypothetical protein
MTTNIKMLLLALLFFTACFHKKNNMPEGHFCLGGNTISKIKVINKTRWATDVQEIVVTDPDQIALFCNEMNKLKKVEGRINTKSTAGFWDVSLTMADNTHEPIGVLRTVYQGVAIRYQDTYYKNDDMDFLIVHWFSEAKP